MHFPYELPIIGEFFPSHYFFELLGYFLGFQLYLFLKKKWRDDYGEDNRLLVLMGAILGAALGSKLLGFLEHPELNAVLAKNIMAIMAAKTILGGLVGGLIGVEIAKKVVGIKRSSGDIYVFPLITGITIGRIGCFLQGVSDATWGKPTNSIFGIDGGDGILRHPAPLYEIIFLLILALSIWQMRKLKLREGDLFKIFMASYCMWRFLIEFIKPVVTYLPFSLSIIQMVSILVVIYYLIYFANRKIRGQNASS